MTNLTTLPTFRYEYDHSKFDGTLSTLAMTVDLDPTYILLPSDEYSVVRDGNLVDVPVEELVFDFTTVVVERDTRHATAMTQLRNLADSSKYSMRSARKGEEDVDLDLVSLGVDSQLNPAVLYGDGSKHDVDGTIANPRYGLVTSDLPWYAPPKRLGYDAKLISKKYNSEFYLWQNGFVIDDVDDVGYEFLKSVFNSTPLVAWFKRSAKTGKTVAVATNKFREFTLSHANGKPCYRYSSDKHVFLEDFSRTLVTYRDTHGVKHFNIDEVKMTVTTAITERRHDDAMNELTYHASYMTRELMTYIVADVDLDSRYDFLHSLDLPSTHDSQRVTNDEDILEMFGLL